MPATGTRYRPAKLVVAWTMACAAVASCQTCNLSSPVLVGKLQTPDYLTASSGWAFSQALAYLDAYCYREARQSLDKADAALIVEKTGSRDEKERRQFAQNGLRQYIDALDLFAQARRDEAKQKLFHLVDENRTSDVYFRSTLTLASWLAEEHDAREWGRIEPYLKELSGRGFEFWQTDFLIRNHQVTVGQGEAAIRELTVQLAGNLGVERKLALEILLSEIMFRTGHLLDAQVMTSLVEDEVGLKVLDISLRLRFLGLSANIWNSVAQAGGGPYAIKRAQTYSEALARAQSELGQ
jgi:hypothetical protein